MRYRGFDITITQPDETLHQIIRLQEAVAKLAQWQGIDLIDLEEEGFLAENDLNLFHGCNITEVAE